MSHEALISYAQNGEDIVLWRALRHVHGGRYVDVGACDPVELSVTKTLYDRGWRGIDIDAVSEYAERLQAARPGNEVVNAAVTDRPVKFIAFHQFADTGLSTLVDDTAAAHEGAGFNREDIMVPALSLDAVCERSSLLGHGLHVLKIDVEGAEAEVLRSFDIRRWRPWVVVVEATVPLTSEPAYVEWDPILTAAGYTCTLFDGISRYYVSPDHLELTDDLSYPACALDDYVSVKQHRQDVRVDELTLGLAQTQADALRWRNEAVAYWANAVAKAQASEDLANEAQSETAQAVRALERMRETLQEVRGDRRRLRAKIKRMNLRIRRLTVRIEATNDPAPGVDRLRSRLRSVVRRTARE